MPLSGILGLGLPQPQQVYGRRLLRHTTCYMTKTRTRYLSQPCPPLGIRITGNSLPLYTRPLLTRMPGLSNLLKAKTFGLRTYPTEAVCEHFRSSLDRFEVKKSLVAKRGSYCRGLFLKKKKSYYTILPLYLLEYTHYTQERIASDVLWIRMELWALP